MAASKPKKPVEKSTLRAELNTSLGDQALKEAAERLEDRPRLMQQIAGFAQAWETEVFRTGGVPGGKKWAPLARSTQLLGGPRRPGVRTGELLRLLTGQPRILTASVQLRGPEHAEFLKAGRYGPKSKVATGGRAGVEGLGGNMPRRNPAPRPPKERLAELTADLLGMITPRDRT